MKKLNEVKKSIRFQWNEMLDRGIMPIFEFQIAEDDWLIVNIELTDDTVMFIFSFSHDDDHLVCFSDDVEEFGYKYALRIDEYNDQLDPYLEQISNEITEGFLIPNNLYYVEGN